MTTLAYVGCDLGLCFAAMLSTLYAFLLLVFSIEGTIRLASIAHSRLPSCCVRGRRRDDP